MRSASKRPPAPYRPTAPARGAASLIVVMVLFFVISLVAAYTSRNLIFEQRTSGNQYRSTLAFEAADAGIEWALARLNGARMNDDCTPLTSAAAVSSPPQDSFRERYLAIDAGTGIVTPRPDTSVSPSRPRLAGCVFDGSDWSCHCPASGDPDLSGVTLNGTGPHAAFWVRFTVPPMTPPRPGIVRVDVNACTRAGPDCLKFDRQAQSGDGLAALSAVLALRSGLGSPPNAPLLVRGTTSAAPGATLSVTNDDPAAEGTTVLSGALFNPALATLQTLPGTPVARSVIDDDPTVKLPDLVPALVPATPANHGADRMFNSVFGMWPSTFMEQPAAAIVECAAGCNASDADGVADMALLEPGHVIYVKGAGPLRIDTDLGTAASPVLVVAEGSVEFGGAPQTVRGVVYSRAATWTTANAGTVQGAIVAEQDLRVVGTQTLIYDAAVMSRLRLASGSFVKVPGGWRDFAP
ncbi:MAG: pilus assembly PilX N-terminal domain-containing protein [Proteobacteria bacterium]|jgi:hypothetical protein|nr:pilus assembly PilX N-terminal domain-containing protein [Pseudomonadota bacterium]